jgi:hypothetical protein
MTRTSARTSPTAPPAARALATGIVTRWDHVSPDDAPDRYISSGRDFWGALEQSRLAAPEG